MKKYLLQTFLLILVTYTFQAPIANLLDWILVKNILSQVTSSLLNDLLFFLGAFLIFRFLYRRVDDKVLYSVGLATAVAYFFNRFEPTWAFTPMQIVPRISYFDLIAAALVLPSIIKLLSLAIKSTPNTPMQIETSNKDFAEDIAIDTIENDSFNRSETARVIANRIQSTKNERSFAIGIIGEYGSGKTSFLNLIRYHLIQEENTPITINFNPWVYESPNDIQRAFFSLLVAKIAEHDSSLSSQILTYSRRLRENDSSLETIIKRIELVSSFIANDKTSEFDKINERIAQLKQKVVIFIDDIDRLHPEEIIEVLRLIRNTASFANVFYLVGYDRNYVVDALKKVNEKGHSNYLDKIFQLEVPLPKTEYHTLIAVLKSKLKPILSDTHYSELEKNLLPLHFESDFDDSVKQVFRNPRDIIKFVNSLLITYELIGKEVDFKDLFFNELLKFRYPAVYDMIYEKTDIFLHLISYSYRYNEYYALATLEGDKETLALTHHLKTNHAAEYSELDHLLINRILQKLYSEGRNHPKGIAPNAICSPAYFNLYYQNRLSQFDISEFEFNTIKQKDLGTIYKYIDSCFSKGKHKQLLTRFLKEDFLTDRLYYEKMIRAVFYIGPKYITAEDFTSFPVDEFLPKFVDISGTITQKIYKNNKEAYQKFVTNMLDSREWPPFLFQNEVIFKIKEKYLAQFPISEEKLTKIQLNYFSEMSGTSHGLSEEVMWLFWGIRHKMKNPQTDDYFDQWTLDGEAIRILKYRLNANDATHFLKTTIERVPFQDGFYNLTKKILGEIYTSPKELRQMVEENNYTPDTIQEEYLGFLKACENVEFSKPVEYEFRTILNPESKGSSKN